MATGDHGSAPILYIINTTLLMIENLAVFLSNFLVLKIFCIYLESHTLVSETINHTLQENRENTPKWPEQR